MKTKPLSYIVLLTIPGFSFSATVQAVKTKAGVSHVLNSWLRHNNVTAFESARLCGNRVLLLAN